MFRLRCEASRVGRPQCFILEQRWFLTTLLTFIRLRKKSTFPAFQETPHLIFQFLFALHEFPSIFKVTFLLMNFVPSNLYGLINPDGVVGAAEILVVGSGHKVE